MTMAYRAPSAPILQEIEWSTKGMDAEKLARFARLDPKIDLLVAASRDHTKLVLFDVKTQKWSDLVSLTKPGIVVKWAHALDYKYVYYTTGGPEPQTLRVRLSDHKVETITSLKD